MQFFFLHCLVSGSKICYTYVSHQNKGRVRAIRKEQDKVAGHLQEKKGYFSAISHIFAQLKNSFVEQGNS